MNIKQSLIQIANNHYRDRIHKLMGKPAVSEYDSLRKLHAAARLEKRRKDMVTMLHGDPYFTEIKE